MTTPDEMGPGRGPDAHESATQGPAVLLVDVLERLLTRGIVVLHEADASALPLHVIELNGHTVVTTFETYATTSAAEAAESESSEALMSAVDEYLRRLPMGSHSDTP